ncbi:hypothetical protein KP509_39G045600 [Ceratopteris richardii]|uniref:G3BP-like protein n=2 Tax=Ceratopteris richardii TaxID=49495 RepID=A0A8T2Q0Z7_CERRI|nr:hypothetical protein KP509_39G045600 [Ceratopteris richardii]KAH7277328.1 hypothetical protein KP509_39G045600 [Ceratopteris richardii]KAH7277329.1 hypothetical protein KP509_39G045600 [Ceratopteris richardii]
MAANLGSLPSPVGATASLVGNTFVSKYYNVLHQSPDMVYRFYTDRSILSRAEAGASGAVDIVIAQAGINQKIMSLDYVDFRAEIKTVDSLESLNGSVLVMVTGSLSSHGRPKRNFVQTFFLAPQEVGYFVLNDMFRYLDGEAKPVQPHVPMENGSMEQHAPTPIQGVVDVQPSLQQEARETVVLHAREAHHSEHQTQAPPEEALPTLPVGEAPEVAEVPVQEVEVPPAADIVDGEASIVEGEAALPSEETNAEEAPKKSYASILRVRSDASSSSTATPAVAKSSSAKHERAIASSQTLQQNHVATTSKVANELDSPGQEEASTAEPEGDGRSIYIKNLPLSITSTELENEFKKFGLIKPGGVNLRNQRVGVCFAFIEYEESSSSQSAIQASPILIGGRQVYVEEKKPMPVTQRAIRGRFNQVRGYQNDAMRGRGYFGGRGFARGSGQDYDREGGRGMGTGRGSYGAGNSSYASNYGSNFNSVNGYRRTDSQGWNGPRPVRRGAGNQGGRGRGQTQE